MEETKSRRIHIGNISAQLAENGSRLESRLANFGKITKPLLFHTKPINDYFFAFVEIEGSEKQFEKLRTSLHGVVFMGRKLTVSLAKPDFEKAWQRDSRRPGPSKREVQILQGIALARSLRVAESETNVPSNSILRIPIGKTSVIGANNSSMGYFKSAHTTGNASGNTKNKSPAHDLIGYKSYGSSLKPRSQNTQQYSRTSGGGEIVKGRIRKTARPDSYFARKEQTLRILINGELKQIRCYKTKLWGVEKNKTARDLTYRFYNNAWRSGDDHIVERVVRAVPEKSCGVDGEEAAKYGKNLVHENDEQSEGEESEFGEEKAKSASVLAKLLTSYDFDKPVALEDESDEETVTYDSKGRKSVEQFDYEAAGVVEFDNSASTEATDVNAQALLDDLRASGQPAEEVYYDEDDEGNDLDFDALGLRYATEAIKETYDEEHKSGNRENGGGAKDSLAQKSADHESGHDSGNKKHQTDEGGDSSSGDSSESGSGSDSESGTSSDTDSGSSSGCASSSSSSSDSVSGKESTPELMPSFALPSFGQPASNTETLRSLFNLEKSSGFSLALDEDDIDESHQIAEQERLQLLEQIKSKQKTHVDEISSAARANRFGLFWTHFESPFLQTQTQLSKIGHVGENVKLPGEDDGEIQIRDDGHGEEDAYERWFWSVRGEVGRECKRRKRDVVRMFKKKSAKPSI